MSERGTKSQLGDVSVVVIGAGFGGLTAAMMLRKEGVTNLRIIERSAGVGGTWFNNCYPGAEVDVPSSCYSWDFKRFDWSRTHARQPEIQKYVDEAVAEQGLRSHLTLGVSVTELVWEDARRQWRVTLSNGEILHAHFVISAVGLLSDPRYPNWPGYADFKGTKVHTAAWDRSVELAGKRVAVVGVGSSGAQVVPTIAPIVEQLYLYQRESGWVLPKPDRDYTAAERERLRTQNDARYRKARRIDFWNTNKGMIFGRVYRPRTKFARKSQEFALAYIAEVFKDRPDLRQAVTPKYGFAGKRVVASAAFYPALLRDNVKLIPRGVQRLTETAVVDTAGVETPVDVLILATGYEPAKAFKSMRIVGRSGRTLSETWADEPRAFFGITVPDFPNFFMLYGPSTHGGMIFTNHASQARWAILAIRKWRKGKRTYEVRPRALTWYVNWLERQCARTAWMEADSYIKNARGVIVTQWPWDAFAYQIMTRAFGPIAHRAV